MRNSSSRATSKPVKPGKREVPVRFLSKSSCTYCGRLANLSHDDVVVEMPEGAPSPDTITKCWHRECFNSFLDQGEET